MKYSGMEIMRKVAVNIYLQIIVRSFDLEPLKIVG